MENNQDRINTKGVGWKNFLPAKWEREMGQVFTAKTGIVIKQPGRAYRSPVNVPDEAERAALGGRLALNLPAINMRVGDMLDALEQVAGPKVRAMVRFERDERIAGIVANWPTGASAARAAALGLKADASFADIIRQYIDDCRASGATQALKGLDA